MFGIIHIIFLFILLNISILKFFGASYPIFIVDIFILCSFFTKRKIFRSILLTSIIIIFLIDVLAQSYFFDIVNFLEQSASLSTDIISANLNVIIFFSIISLFSFFVFYFSPPPKFLPSLIVAIILILFDALQGSSSLFRIDNHMHRFGGFDVASSISNRLIRQSLQSSPVVELKSFPSIYSAMEVATKEKADLYVLIIVESLGLPKSAINKKGNGYQHILLRHSKLKVIKEGYVPSVGGTVSGELRELCGKAIPMMAMLRSYSDCWPKKFATQGFYSAAAHSYRSTFYERNKWWVEAGFGSIRFMDTPGIGYPRHKGGALTGVDDRIMLASELARYANKKTFFYYLTSNSHLPLPRGKKVETVLDKALNDVLLGASEGLNIKNKNNLNDFSALLIVVGDHPPPLIGKERNKYVQNKVPFWIIRPN